MQVKFLTPQIERLKCKERNVKNKKKIQFDPPKKFQIRCKIKKKFNTSKKVEVSPDTLVQLSGDVVMKLPLPSALNWKKIDLYKWIDDLGYSDYMSILSDNHINGKTLQYLDASKLSNVNLKNFHDTIDITKSIRKLYDMEMINYIRSISLSPRYPWTHFVQYKGNSGQQYENTNTIDLFRKMKIVGPPPMYQNHFDVLENWLRHPRCKEYEMIGYARRENLYKLKKKTHNKAAEICKNSNFSKYKRTLKSEEKEDICYNCHNNNLLIILSEEYQRKLSISTELNEEKSNRKSGVEQYRVEEESVASCSCIPPCNCKWIIKRHSVPKQNIENKINQYQRKSDPNILKDDMKIYGTILKRPEIVRNNKNCSVRKLQVKFERNKISANISEQISSKLSIASSEMKSLDEP